MEPSEFEVKLHAWRDCENAASELEKQLRNAGQGASDPRAAELHLRAGELRRQADALLAEIVRSVKEASDGVLRRDPGA